MSAGRRGFPLRVFVWGAVATALTLVAYLGLTGALAVNELSQARGEALRIAAQAQSRDPDLRTMIDEVGALRADLMRAQAYTSGPVWWLASKAPIVGSRVDALRRVSQGAGEVARKSAALESVARAFLAAGNGKLGHAIPRDVLARLGPAAADLATAIEDAQEQFAGIDATALPDPLGPKLYELQVQMAAVGPEVEGLAAAAGSIAALLGRDGPQRWFIAMQNGGESRGTGGLVGAFAIVNVDAGAPSLERMGPNDALTAKADAGLLPADSQALWGDRRLAEIYGVNLSPNFPFAGELLASMWERQTAQRPDAVLALDQRAVAGLFAVTGPITVDGVTLTADNAYTWLTVDAYRRFPTPEGKDAFVLEVTRTLMQRLTSGSIPTAAFVHSVVEAALGRHVYLWASDPMVQSDLNTSPLGGRVPDQPGPFAMAVVNNNAGNKLDTFLQTSVSYRGGACVAGGRRTRIDVDLRNDAPTGLPDSYFGRFDRAELEGLELKSDGSNRVRLAVYLPAGAYIDQALFSTPGSARPLFAGTERGHPVLMFGVELPRGESRRTSVEFTMFGDPIELNADPNVVAQPMLNPQQISVERGGSCA